jgi:catechol 2,3-dioxygenase-like lactoylglutathione lyase family enzyme
MDMKLEVVTLPVSDVDRAKDFYTKLGFREDADAGDDDFRIVQLTPPGSAASIFVGKGLVAAEPGSVKGLVLVVGDIEAAYDELVEKGIGIGQIFHGPKGLAYYSGGVLPEPGIEPDRKSYFSFTAFSDPDGNGWIVQEITQRLPGRV